VPGKGLFRDSQSLGEWKDVLINGFDSDRSVFTGYWDNTSEYVELTRINLLFNAEDPRIFAQRVAQAHTERIYADSIIRYNFFIDNMPPQELPELDSEQTQRIISMATAARALKMAGKIETQTILSEVGIDFGRTMNRIIMEKAIEMERDGTLQGDETMSLRIPHQLTLPPPEPPKPVAELGMVPIPEHDFPEQFSNFCFNSLFIKEEVIKAMVEIRSECNDMMEKHRIWNTLPPTEGKPHRLENFKQIQSSAISNIKFQTQENGWVGRLQKLIQSSFSEVGKGWFNIHENSKETYEFGKLKKFLTLVNFMMQDTVLTICHESVESFHDFLLQFIPEETIITDTSTVVNKFKPKPVEETPVEASDSELEEDQELAAEEDENDPIRKRMREIDAEFKKEKFPEPLFVLDLVLKQGELVPKYSTNPEDIVNSIMDIFDDGIKAL
jgi:dynein heavy chain